MRRWRAIAFSACLASTGCARSYHAEHAQVVRAPALNARLEGLATGLGTVSVRLQVAGRAGVRLFDARLARMSVRPCSAGRTFARIESDGSVIAEGPLDLAGSHELRLHYADEAGFPTLRAGAAIDLEIEEGRLRSCVRLPLVEAPGAPTWTHLRGTSAAMGSRFRVSPIPIHDPGEIAPEGSVLLRMAATGREFALWFDGGGAFGTGPGERTSGNLLLASGVAFALWRSEDWAVWLDGGYQLVWHLESERQGEPGEFRYFFHGPELAPRLSYALWNLPYLSILPGGATLHLELELPVTLWIGTDEAPRTTLSTAVGAGVLLEF